jgi:hypothetical protein
VAKIRWATIRRIWITAGITFTVIFVLWSLIAFRASGEARQSIEGNDAVAVTEREHHWLFQPRVDAADVGLVFFPGGMVDPVAYAPPATYAARAHRMAATTRSSVPTASSPAIGWRRSAAKSSTPRRSRLF